MSRALRRLSGDLGDLPMVEFVERLEVATTTAILTETGKKP